MVVLIDRYRQQTGIDVDFNHDVPGERLPSAVETAVYRIAQEALTNVARHSGALRAQITLQRSADRVTVTIADEGGGFNRGSVDRSLSSGLSNMCERAALLGGTFSVTSAPCTGTTIIASFPARP